MDRLGFFKQGLSSLFDAASTVVGLKQAANSFVEVVDEALSNIKTDIGLHLPSLDAGMYDDPEGTLSGVAQAGYSMIEVGSYCNGKVQDMTPERLKELAHKAGLKITSAHINHLHQSSEDSTAEAFENSADAEAAKRAARWAAMASGATVEGAIVEGATEEGGIIEEVAAEDAEGAKDVAEEEGVVGVTENAEVVEDTTTEDTESKPDPNDEWWCKALDIHKKLGCRYIVMSRLPDYPTEEVVAEYATYFNRIGELTAERGMQFCYHPRQQEFKAADGTSPFEVIVANTDPKKVHFEIDTYEAAEAGVDVNELLKRLTKRITLLHIRDYGIVGESEKINFEKIIAEGIRTGVKDIFVEVRNFSLPPMNCVERSFYNVESLPSISY
jgi:sugar phosphate isomerase/epimerase